MHSVLVLTLIGRDRPGLVERLATLITQHHGNWLESRMSRLGGEFAGILRFTVAHDHEEALRTALLDLGTIGLAVAIRRDDAPAPAPTRLATLELLGHDRPGIVRQVATVLAAHAANVEELTTECASAPMSGEPLFKAAARVALPEGSDLSQLRTDLERVAADLVVDITLAPLADAP